MSREEALKALRAIRTRQTSGQRDEEVDHADADDVLLALINDPEITEAYGLIESWYA